MSHWLGRRGGILTVLGAALATGLWAGVSWIPPAGSVPIGAGERECRVDWVHDGDSLRLICRGGPVEVRLHCIDAPEHDQVPWAERSRRHLVELLPPRVKIVQRDLDKYGRQVVDLYAPGSPPRLVNLEQVEAGQAAVYERYCDDARFDRAERQARQARLGIWSRPGEQQMPWIYRHRHPR